MLWKKKQKKKENNLAEKYKKIKNKKMTKETNWRKPIKKTQI